MQKKIKQWYDRHKQKIIIGLVTIALIILCLGVIVRGIYTLRSTPATTDSIQNNNISFSLVNLADTATFSSKTNSDDKLYREREETVSSSNSDKDVDISFGAILEKEGGVNGNSSTPVTQDRGSSATRQHTPSEAGLSSTQTEDRQRIKQALDEIYGNRSDGSNSNRSVINNTHSEKTATPQRPPTPEELLAQRKKLMEEGFDKQSLTTTATQVPSAMIYISSPEEIPAFIHGAQTVKNNNRLALRLDVTVSLSNGQIIPRNTIIYARIEISNNRVLVNVESIKYRTMNYTLSLIGFAEDGMPGLPVESEQNQKIIEDASSSAVATAIDRKISTVTGGLVGSVVRDISNASRSRKESYVSFIDNRRVFLHPVANK